MSRPQRDCAWLAQRGGLWYVFWYSPSSRQTRRKSLKTDDRAAAETALRAFNKEYLREPIPVREHDYWRQMSLRMCRRARENAKRKDRTYAIDADYVLDVLASQGFRCAVTNMRFSTAKEHRNPFAPSLDQIHPGRGYLPGNVRVVTVIANTAMNGWGEGALRRLILESRLVGQWPAKNVPKLPEREISTSRK